MTRKSGDLSPRERARIARREKPAGGMLPYARHVDDATLALRDGGLMHVIRLEGFPFETADTEELNYRKAVRETMLRGVANSRLALYHHVVRRQVRPQVDGQFSNGFARRLDALWRERLDAKRLFVNDLFLTLVRRPATLRSGPFASLFEKGASLDAVGRARDKRELDSATESMLAALQAYAPRLLTAYETPNGACSEPLEFIAYLFTGDLRPVPTPAPNEDASLTLPLRRVSFGMDTLELAPGEDSERAFAAMLSLRDYPPNTAPGQFDALFRAPREFVLTESFAFTDRQVALGRMNLALRRMRAADDEAISLRRDLTTAKDDVAAGRSAFGEHHVTLMVKAQSLEGLDEAVADMAAGLTETGAIPVREDVALEPSFWAQFPGNFQFTPRKALISSANFASLASLHNHPLGRARGNHWGPAVAVLETTAASPYYFNFHRGDLGNFIVIGPSGSGKTVILNFLLAQAQKFNPRVVFFDKDRGAEIFLRAMGARYDVLRAGVRTGFNPLRLADNPVNRRFLQRWTAKLLSAHGETLTADDNAVIADAVSANFDQAADFRRLRYFKELFAGARRPSTGDLAARLAPWVGDGDRAWLFDNEADHLDLGAGAIGFDMTQVLDDPIARTPVMMYLFHRVEERLDGNPTIIVVDEGWKALDDDVFVQRIRDWEKTIRKRNGIVGFATQSAGDALDSRVASAIIEQSATQLFLPNPKAQESEYCGGFGLTRHEFDLIRTLPDTSRCFLVKHGADSVVARLNLNGMEEIVTVLSGRERTVRLLDELRSELGDDPAAWMPRLLQKAR
ncbi:MAG TPA: VirB4 family type IV secretion/conjugal transfer ATPase [Caulobacterales bacterium]|nr:VirB4 family type IV secretion/conjugal transfer ATPase [Caulobacterales bacterium]